MDLPPHIYALTDNMYRNMMIESENQCVIIRCLNFSRFFFAMVSFIAHSTFSLSRVQRRKWCWKDNISEIYHVILVGSCEWWNKKN